MFHGINFPMVAVTQDTELRADAERLAEILTSLQRCLILNISKELARGNVSFPQYCLLGFLSQQPHLTMTEIAQRMGHTTAAATGLVDRLEKLGHVRRLHAQDDRRKILVEVTESGTALVGEVRDDMVGNILKIMELLEPSEQKAWLQIYQKISAFCQSK
jgi:DNA-binding MarR family transcriptional regulator